MESKSLPPPIYPGQEQPNAMYTTSNPNQYPQGQYPNQYPQGQYPNQYPQGSYPNSHGNITIPSTSITSPVIIGVGNCPNCRMGVLTEEYDGCGICLAICFFPIGILCCLAMTKRRCTNCNCVF